MGNIVFEFVLPTILFGLLIFALLKKIKLSDDDKINLLISFSLALIGAYSLYQLNLSSTIISAGAITLVAIFIALIIVSSLKVGLKKLEEKQEENK
jgi:uncharacterized membrane protein